MITFPCCGCSQTLRVKDELIGKEVKCPKCGDKIRVAPAMSFADGANEARTPPRPQLASEESAATLPPTSGAERFTLPPANQTPGNGHTRSYREDDAPAEPNEVQIPGYDLLGELGRGGMGVVYKARHKKLNRLVALKMILAGSHAGEAELARFQVEAEAIARLQHPNIVQVHEVGEHEGKPFFSLEYCCGGSLAHKLGGTPLPAREAAALVETLARAMQAAHDQHIIHRDLKPANVLLTEGGVPKITDFGLAKRLDEAGQTQSGAIMGTPSYMAPEQAAGASSAVGHLADVYTLGAILYECLTGRPPFKAATSLETILQVAMDEPVPPSQLQSKMPKDLETLCLKCLQKNPAKRYASAKHLAEDLGRFLEGEPVLARPVGKMARVWRWCCRKPALAAASAAAALGVFLALVTFGVAFVVVDGQRIQAEKLAKEKNDLAAKEHKTAEDNKMLAKVAEEGRRLAEKRELRGRFDQLHFRSRDEPAVALVGSAKLLPEVMKLKDQPLLDSIMLHLGAWSRDVYALRAVYPHEEKVLAVAFSPDAKSVLTASADGTARLWETATGRPLGPPLKHQAWARTVAFSPDGKTIITGSDDKTARLWETATGKQIGPTLVHQNWVMDVAFSPNGKYVLTRSYDKTARLWETATGKQVAHLQLQGQILAATFGPDGRTILTGSEDKTARLWEINTGKQIGPPLQHHEAVLAVAFSPNGKTVLTGSGVQRGAGVGEGRLWEVATGKQIGLPVKHEHQVSIVAFSPDGKIVLTGGADSKVHLSEAATGKQLTPPLQNERMYMLRAAAFSPDGKTVLTGSGDGTARLWEVATGKQLGHPLQCQGMVEAVTFNPNGRTVLTGSLDGIARLWEIDVPKQLLHPGPVSSVAFSPDGKIVLTGCLNDWAQLWETTTGKPFGLPLRQEGQIIAVVFSQDGRTVLTRGNKTVHVWDVATGKQLGPAAQPKEYLLAAALSPDGKKVLTGSGKTVLDHSSGGAQLWDAATGRQLCPILHHESPVVALAFSPDGKTLLTGSYDKTVRLWETGTGKAVLPPLSHDGKVRAVAFSPDGKTIITGSNDKTARLWEAATGKSIGRLQHQDGISAVAFSPDGRVVLTGSYDKSAQLWETATGKQLGAPLQHQDGVVDVTFSPDGKTVLTRTGGKMVRLWEVATGKQLGLPLQHQSSISAAAFSPDGKTVLTGSADKTAQLWRVPSRIRGDPEQVLLWTQVITGMELDEHGFVRILDTATWQQRRLRLQELGGPPKNESEAGQQ